MENITGATVLTKLNKRQIIKSNKMNSNSNSNGKKWERRLKFINRDHIPAIDYLA